MFKTERNEDKTKIFYKKLYIAIFVRENSSHPPQLIPNESLYMKLPEKMVFLSSDEASLSLLVDTKETFFSTFFDIAFLQH